MAPSSIKSRVIGITIIAVLILASTYIGKLETYIKLPIADITTGSIKGLEDIKSTKDQDSIDSETSFTTNTINRKPATEDTLASLKKVSNMNLESKSLGKEVVLAEFTQEPRVPDDIILATIPSKNTETYYLYSLEALNSKEISFISNSLQKISPDTTTGSAKIDQGNDEVTVKELNITADSLVNITPTSPTGNQVIYLKEQGKGYFKAGFEAKAETDVNFNWSIIY